jgi:hypothetical protein
MSFGSFKYEVFYAPFCDPVRGHWVDARDCDALHEAYNEASRRGGEVCLADTSFRFNDYYYCPNPEEIHDLVSSLVTEFITVDMYNAFHRVSDYGPFDEGYTNAADYARMIGRLFVCKLDEDTDYHVGMAIAEWEGIGYFDGVPMVYIDYFDYASFGRDKRSEYLINDKFVFRK